MKHNPNDKVIFRRIRGRMVPIRNTRANRAKDYSDWRYKVKERKNSTAKRAVGGAAQGAVVGSGLAAAAATISAIGKRIKPRGALIQNITARASKVKKAKLALAAGALGAVSKAAFGDRKTVRYEPIIYTRKQMGWKV